MTEHRLVLGDGIAGMATMPDRSVDHFIFDAPYSDRIHANIGHESRNDGHAPRADVSFGSLASGVADMAAREMVRLARRWIVAFGDEWSFAVWRDALAAAGADYWRFGLWIKSDAMPQLSGDGPGTPAEHLCLAHSANREGRKRWNGGGRVARWVGPCQERNVERVHPTQKPEWLMEALVRDFTDAGELICDPFAGSATTGAACKRLGRSFVGWEIDPGFYEVGRKRLDAAREQFQLPRIAKPRQVALALPEEKEPAA